MSSTVAYRLGDRPDELFSIRNSWRGAMYVWNQIARDYFELDGFPLSFDRQADKAGAIWNAEKTHALQDDEKIVLRSTMDSAVSLGTDLPAVVAAFASYGARHPSSSYAEHAELFRKADVHPDEFVAWLQTTVSEFWGRTVISDEDGEEEDEEQWYDPRTGSKHFSIVDPPLSGQGTS